MASKVALASSTPVVIPGPKDLNWVKVTVWLNLNSGTVSLTPTVIVQDSADMLSAAGVPTGNVAVEYNIPSTRSTKTSAAFAATGMYEFDLFGESLVLTPGAVTGAPFIVWSITKVGR